MNKLGKAGVIIGLSAVLVGCGTYEGVQGSNVKEGNVDYLLSLRNSISELVNKGEQPNQVSYGNIKTFNKDINSGQFSESNYDQLYFNIGKFYVRLRDKDMNYIPDTISVYEGEENYMQKIQITDEKLVNQIFGDLYRGLKYKHVKEQIERFRTVMENNAGKIEVKEYHPYKVSVELVIDDTRYYGNILPTQSMLSICPSKMAGGLSECPIFIIESELLWEDGYRGYLETIIDSVIFALEQKKKVKEI